MKAASTTASTTQSSATNILANLALCLNLFVKSALDDNALLLTSSQTEQMVHLSEFWTQALGRRSGHSHTLTRAGFVACRFPVPPSIFRVDREQKCAYCFVSSGCCASW
jgi:hypothetical protein